MKNKLFNPAIAYALLLILCSSYTLYFSAYTLHRHQTLHSYAADLSLIAQPMWNTARGSGSLMELTWGEQQQPRFAEHFEPLLIPLSGLFWLWPDVRVLLIAQTLVLALGVIPVYHLARAQLQHVGLSEATGLALVMAGVYLLSPHLQAANVADFHADPFAVTALLWAFYSAHQAQWGRMWFWAIMVMATKEPLPTLTAMLGVWLLISPPFTPQALNLPRKHGLALILVSLAWFLMATFLIVAPLARHYFGTNGPIYFTNRYNLDTLFVLTDPNRWAYGLGLLASMGFLPLLAPDLLLLGLPVFLANFFSNFSGQYSGEQHYSAPLVAALIIATIYGTDRALRLGRYFRPTTPLSGLLLGLTAWLLAWSLGYHIQHGWTPLSLRTEYYATSPVAPILPRYLAQIPAEAAVSASAGVHPHIALRRVAYIFPTVATADYLLVDINDVPGTHPYDVRHQLEDLLREEWQLLQADTGLILARRAPHAPQTLNLPASFFSFARQTPPSPLANPLSFNNGQLQLTGYTIHDDPDNGLSFQFYWQATASLPTELELWPVVYDTWGNWLNTPTQTPMITTVWYPPAQWQPHETIMTQTLPQLLPNSFELGLAVGYRNGITDPAQHWTISGQSLAHLATCQRVGLRLNCSPPPPPPPSTLPPLVFSQTLQLHDISLNGSTSPHLTLKLTWTALRPPPQDYTVFIHLLTPSGQKVSQSDQTPTWLWPQPTSTWQVAPFYYDRHTLTLPAPGPYRLKIGLYDPKTLQRLTLPDGSDSYEIEITP